MRMKYRYEVQVANLKGHHFPIDMLRYDGLSPKYGSDSKKIEESFVDQEDGSWSLNPIFLHRLSSDPDYQPNRARWLSFGWEVLEVRKEKLLKD